MFRRERRERRERRKKKKDERKEKKRLKSTKETSKITMKVLCSSVTIDKSPFDDYFLSRKRRSHENSDLNGNQEGLK